MHLIRVILLPMLAVMIGCEVGSKGEQANGGQPAIEEHIMMQKPAHQRVAELIDSCWDFREPEASEQRFREATSQEDQEPARLVLLTQVARAQGLQRRFDAAHATLDEVQRQVSGSLIAEEVDAVRPWYAIERGRVFNSSAHRDEAQPFFEEAWETAKRLDLDALAVDAAHMLAIVASGDESVRWNLRALELAESSGDRRAQRWRASLHNNLGWSSHERGEYDRALGHFQQALAEREAAGQVRETLIARWAVARCLRSMGRVGEALAHQMELGDAWERLGEPDGYVLEEIGECLLLQDWMDEAGPYFAEAYRQLRSDPWLSANEPERLRRLAQLGGLEPPTEQERAAEQ